MFWITPMWMQPHTNKLMETNTNTPEAKQPASAGCHPTPCYLSLWHSLMTADGNAVEAHACDEAELAQLRERGLVRGGKWIRFTEHGLKLCNAISFK
jgi:hypothetical protein